MSAAQESLSLEMVGLIGLGAFAAVAIDATWQVVCHFTVMAHEGAHAVLGSLMGRGVNGITINTQAEGGTDVGPGGRPGSVAIGFAGYMGPSAFGLGAAGLIQLGHSDRGARRESGGRRRAARECRGRRRAARECRGHRRAARECRGRHEAADRSSAS